MMQISTKNIDSIYTNNASSNTVAFRQGLHDGIPIGMTFPAILQETQTPAAGALALGVGVATAWRGMSLFHVACCCCAVVFIAEFIMVP